MLATLFDNYRPINRYDRVELCKQFNALATATNGKFSEVSLNWHFSGSNIVVRDIYWHGYPADLWLEHDWTIHTNLAIDLPAGLQYELRFNNVYGGASGVPIVGPPRVESDMVDEAVSLLLPEMAYWQLALTQEPFALTLAKERLTLASYRFYPHQFHLDALDYLTDLAERMEELAKSPIPVKANVSQAVLPWLI